MPDYWRVSTDHVVISTRSSRLTQRGKVPTRIRAAAAAAAAVGGGVVWSA